MPPREVALFPARVGDAAFFWAPLTYLMQTKHQKEKVVKKPEVSIYRWNPPKWTEEEIRRSREENDRFLNEAARRSKLSARWVRAAGGTPDPDLPND